MFGVWGHPACGPRVSPWVVSCCLGWGGQAFDVASSGGRGLYGTWVGSCWLAFLQGLAGFLGPGVVGREEFFKDGQGLLVEGAGFGFAASGADNVGEIAGGEGGADVAGAEGFAHG